MQCLALQCLAVGALAPIGGGCAALALRCLPCRSGYPSAYPVRLAYSTGPALTLYRGHCLVRLLILFHCSRQPSTAVCSLRPQAAPCDCSLQPSIAPAVSTAVPTASGNSCKARSPERLLESSALQGTAELLQTVLSTTGSVTRVYIEDLSPPSPDC